MSDTYGALQLPAPAPGATDVAGDPAIQYLASFLAAVLKSDLDTAWAVVAPGQHVVDTATGGAVAVYTHDPELDFVDTHLPALFVYRKRLQRERLADDWEGGRSAIAIMWLPEPAAQDKMSLRDPFCSAVINSIDAAIFQGRHPAWTVAGDADTYTPTRGSSLHNYCGFNFVRVAPDSPQITDMTIEVQGRKPLRYRGLTLVVEAFEKLTRDPAAYIGAHASAIDLTLTNDDGTIIYDEFTG